MMEPDRTRLKKDSRISICACNEDIDAYYEGQRMLSVENRQRAGETLKETLAQIMNVRDGDMKTFREIQYGVLAALRSYGRYETSTDAYGAGNFKCDGAVTVRLQNTTKAICFYGWGKGGQ